MCKCARFVWVCAGMRVWVRVCVDVRRCVHVCGCVRVCISVRGCVQMCTGVCECMCGVNFQNTNWRLESLHQRTLIYILYEFLCNSFRGQGPNSLGHLLSPFGSQQSTEDEFPSESGQLFDPQNR